MTDQRNGGIEWTDQTWNPIRGCSKVSQGCKNCYAETMAARFSKPGQPYAEVIADGRWNGKVVLVPEHLSDPLRWQRPRRVFVNSMSDLFHESLSFEGIAAVFAVMAAAPRHTFQLLTKRPQRAREWFAWFKQAAEFHAIGCDCSDEEGRIRTLQDFGARAAGVDDSLDQTPWIAINACPWPLPNVWLGVSVEDQAAADERIPLLLQCPAAVRWISAEPLLGPVLLDNAESSWLTCASTDADPDETSEEHCCERFHMKGMHFRGIDWVVVGGESGPGARQMRINWAQGLRDQCARAKVPFLFKQWGDIDQFGARHGKKINGRRLDDVLHDGYPEVTP